MKSKNEIYHDLVKQLEEDSQMLKAVEECCELDTAIISPWSQNVS